jgi:deoxyribose-phosphate aldolase
MYKMPSVILIDELTMIEKSWIESAIKMYPESLILIAGDIDKRQWFQTRNGKPGKFSEIWRPTDWRYVFYETDYRAKCGKLKQLKTDIRNEMRNVFPKEKPMSVRISASDWSENGISEEEVLKISEAFKNAGADIINVSTGNSVANQKPQTGRMWQTPFSDLIRNTIHIPTITAGYIQDIDQINTIILNGRADLVALGRPLLLDANFVRNAQAYEQFQATDIPNSYKMGISHLYPLKAAERKQAEGMKKELKPKSNKK